MGEPIPPPPRAPRGALVLLAGALAGAALGGGALLLAARLYRGDPPAAQRPGPAEVGDRTHAHGAGAEARAPRWQCPMHPDIALDHPGDCPICGMKLVKVEAGDDPDPATAPAGPRGR
jgi:Cu(I)/Ag(I) efflux system membrane fusion protein